MKTSKLVLKELMVKSFVTKIGASEKETVQGGITPTILLISTMTPAASAFSVGTAISLRREIDEVTDELPTSDYQFTQAVACTRMGCNTNEGKTNCPVNQLPSTFYAA